MPIYEDVLATAGRRTYKHRFDAEPPTVYKNGTKYTPRPQRENPACNDKYGRWVPGGDVQLHLEEIADKVIAGVLDYDTAVRQTESLTDACNRPCATKRDLLMVLSRKREEHHARQA